MVSFGSLWVGRPLSNIEKTCLSSFIYHKHSFTLFVYDMDLEVPSGVVKEDANQIIDSSKIFKTDNSYGPFADMFRYKMLQQTDLTWTDTDNICLRDDWNFGKYLFGMQGGPHQIVANGLLRAPKDSQFISELVDISSSYDKDKIVWGEIGPQLVTAKIKEHNLEHYIQNPMTFYPINYWQWELIFKSGKRDHVLEVCQNSHTLQIWNQMLNRQGYNNNEFVKGSAMQYFYQKYAGNK